MKINNPKSDGDMSGLFPQYVKSYDSPSLGQNEEYCQKDSLEKCFEGDQAHY